MRAIVAAASAAVGVAFDQYRASTLSRRVALRIAQLGVPDGASYAQLLARDPSEARTLADLLLVGTTEAFRDEPVFRALRTEVFPALVARRLAGGAKRLRIWSAGTSTGDEAFSLAAVGILVADGRMEIDVLATDASPVALERAARGVLPRSHLDGVPEEARRFFRDVPGRAQSVEVTPEVKERVVFARHDLLDETRIAPREAVVASFDVVSCRNVLIYLRPDAVLRTSERLVKACAPGGILILGTAEQAPDALRDQLAPVPGAPSVYVRQS